MPEWTSNPEPTQLSSTPPPAAPAPADPPRPEPVAAETARQRIAAIRADKAHPFHQGDKAAIAEMQTLYETLEPPAPDATAPAPLVIPPQLTADVPEDVQHHFATVAERVGVRGELQVIFSGAMGSAALPSVFVRAPSATEATAQLRHELGVNFDATVARAEDAVEFLEQYRGRVHGRPAGEFSTWLKKSGAGRHPDVVKWLAQLSPHLETRNPALMAAIRGPRMS